MFGDAPILLGAAIGGAGLLGLGRWLWVRQQAQPKICDVSRCIIIVGNGQNDPACIDQRVALKSHLIMIRDASINVIELYGKAPPRRNGKEIEWTENRHLRRALHADDGFHLMCIDDDGEIAMRVRQPVSEQIIGELIAGSVHQALPSPTDVKATKPAEPDPPAVEDDDTSPAPSGEPTDSWSVGVLR